MLALTFDDGPDPRWTPAVLDALAAAQAPATFFVLAGNARAHPTEIGRIRAAGHAVELHGHEHLRHPQAGRAAVAADADAALEVLRDLGCAPRLWRVPWGDLAPWTAELARERGLAPAGWTLDTHDWRGDDAGTMLSAVAPGLQPGAIVLAHDGLGPGATRDGCAETARLVGPLVAAARERGLIPQALDSDWPAPLPVGNPDFLGSMAG